jgi:hypothetical protein
LRLLHHALRQSRLVRLHECGEQQSHKSGSQRFPQRHRHPPYAISGNFA